MSERSGEARVYLGDIPESCIGHEGLRGPIRLDALGVHFDNADIEWLTDGCTEWDGDLDAAEQTIPLHRVHLIEWQATQ